MDILGQLRFRLGSARQASYLHQQIAQNKNRAEQAEKRLQKVETDNQRLKTQNERKAARLKEIDPARLVWIFGNARTGSTWLSRMMSEIHPWWNEPYIGAMFGSFMHDHGFHTRRKDDFILGGKHAMKAIRRFTLYSAGARFGDAERVIIKEPNGSLGAPILSQALPESSIIFLYRDPRDIVASALDAHAPTGFRAKNRQKQGLEPFDPDWLVTNRANTYVRHISASRQAYDSHAGPKIMISYEALRADALNVVMGIYGTLGVEVDGDAVQRAVEKHSWENIPEEGKGSGLDRRKATPGGWREDLTQEQIAEVERITSPLMDELGYERVS